MITGRPKAPLVLADEERLQLNAVAKSRSLPHGLVMRARLVLLAAEGMANKTIAKKLSLSQQSVSLWRQRFLKQGLRGLHDELRPGRPRSISDEKVAQLVQKTLATQPKDGTHWTVRSMAKHARVSVPTVHRIWHAFGLQPHRQRHFKLSPDPFLWKRSAILSACICIRRIRLWFSALMKSLRFKPWIAPNQCCRWASAT